MKILVTGGNGYIAKAIAKVLSKKYEIRTITRQDFDLTNYSATNDYFDNKHFDVVIHTAVAGGSRLVVDGSDVLDKNLQMYYNLLSQKNHYDRLIHFGSGAEIAAPWEPYGLSKRVIANSMRGKAGHYNLRIFAVFDENELDTRFIKGNLLRYINHEPMVVYQNKYMDFFYMEDLIALVDYYIKTENPPQEVDCRYNYSLTLLEIASYINTLDDHKVQIETLNKGIADPYVGNHLPVLSSFVGLADGIHKVFEKLKINH